jgi:hypothetical protein
VSVNPYDKVEVGTPELLVDCPITSGVLPALFATDGAVHPKAVGIEDGACKKKELS